MPKTMTEISRKVGCSPATISRILNNSAPVSPEIREAVLKELRDSGYRPRQRRRESGGATAAGTVEVVLHWTSSSVKVRPGKTAHPAPVVESVPSTKTNRPKTEYRVGTGFYQPIMDGMIQELQFQGFKAELKVNQNLMEPEFLADVNQVDRAGVLLMGQYAPELASFIDCCTRPLVLVDILHDGWPDVVTTDNHGGIRQSLNHLLELGHREIGLISQIENPSYREREMAFRSRMAAAGLPVRPEWVFEHSDSVEHTAEGVEQILALKKRPTAFVCVCDYAALGVIRAANSCGISVPRELSVIGFDDLDSAALVTPALTTIRVPKEQLGRQAARQLLVSRMGSGIHRDERGCEIRMRTELIVRESTAAPSP